VQRNGALDDTGYTTFNQVCMEALMTGSVTGTDINTIKDMIWLSAHSSPDTANKFKPLLLQPIMRKKTAGSVLYYGQNRINSFA
jgi:hypothetical protein